MQNKNAFSPAPPMGWNSWDCYGASVNEEQLLGNAHYVAEKLKDFGWQYIVCDIQWFEPTADSNNYHKFADLCMDGYSRLVPAPNRFPRGFRAIADEIHDLGLKFGIHILRGIPRQAVHRNTPIFGSEQTARDIAHPYSICSWNTDMYGVDASQPGARCYYDSLFSLYASWGVDFVKVDDIAVTEFRPDNPYSAKAEIELIRRAIDRCGRNIILSLSPGPARICDAEHLAQNANMWRMTGDFWDHWDKLYAMFERCEQWNGYRAPGCWPDCDMLPLGKISKTCAYLGEKDRYTNFTPDEQKTMLNLWCMFRSPLFLGGELRENRPEDLRLLQNRELLELNRCSSENRQLFRTEKEAAWCCRDKNGAPVLALFNLSDSVRNLSVDLRQYALAGQWIPTDLWTKQTLPLTEDAVLIPLRAHASSVLRLDPARDF